MLLGEVLSQIPGIRSTAKIDTAICGISYDSRLVQKGHLFVAIKGEKTDGACFARNAVAQGAVAVASEEAIELGTQTAMLVVKDSRAFLAEVSRMFYRDPSSQLKLVGITGTNGKTTTTYMLNSIFQTAGLRSCLVGTTGMKIGSQDFPSERTTPEASDLMRFLRRALADRCTHGAMEVSSHSLVLKRVLGTKFMVGVFTNLTPDHLDFHKDMESYFKAKQLLFSAQNGNRVEAAVINTDDPYGKRLETEVNCPVVRFGFNGTPEIRVLSCQTRADGTDFTLATPLGNVDFRSRLIGRPNIYNTMAATGAALRLGIGLDAVRKGVECLKGVPGRTETVDAGQAFTVIVDYAHSPDALENLLQTVRQLPHGRLITVFGCGGDRDRTKRPVMGEIATRMSDQVIATSDNPRTEDPVQILKEIEPGLRVGLAPYEILPDRRQAISLAISTARKGDVVVIAGKGHEDYQIIGNRSFPFDDRSVALNLIRKSLKPGDSGDPSIEAEAVRDNRIRGWNS